MVSHIRGGYLARYLEDLILQIQAGVWSGALYWLIWWLVLVCALLSAWDLARFLGRTQGEARALALKNQLVMENYRALEQKLRESAQLRHGFAHQVTALDAMVRARDWAGLERWVAARKAEAGDQNRYTGHIAVNAILQDAAARARGLGIPFQVSVAVPRELFVPDEDLCALLMNLLDNALEGAARTPPGREKGIFFQMRVAGNFLPILCENTFDGQVKTDPQGRLQTRKDDPAFHGFGLAQMRAVAEKYSSVLDISWTEERFTVQTALQNPLA
ncbi:ATP-binding protein [Evtepia sp.]